jgi:hypothetical protein
MSGPQMRAREISLEPSVGKLQRHMPENVVEIYKVLLKDTKNN